MMHPQTFDLSKLNDAQRAAVEHLEGPMVIYAGAGSGKTRVITHRIANLIAHGVPPSAILAVTFTNKAAREMRERVEQLVGHRARSIVVSTFHSACARFLRIYAKEAGYTESFSIYDDDDQKSLLKDVLANLNVPDKLLSVATLKGKIDRLKNAGETPETYQLRLRRDAGLPDDMARSSLRRFGEEENGELIQKCYALYQARMKQQNAMDFNDLILVMVELLDKRPDVRAQLQNRFHFFMVDEFQDTNPIQFKFIDLLSGASRNLCIVGDDDQSIYSWRGAEPQFILDFEKHYPGAKIYKLEQNYRSSETIVRVATHIIAHNLKRAPKTLWTSQTKGDVVKIKTAIDPYDEANFITQNILRGLEGGARLSEYAILYRTNAQSRALEDELRRKMLPYIIYGSVRFYERAEIKSLLAYLRLIVNPDDDAAFQRMISVPRRGFGDKALLKLKEAASEQRISLARAADRVANNELSVDIARGVGALKDVSKLFVRAYSTLQMTGRPSLVLADILAGTNFEDYLRTNYPEDFDDRWLNVLELKNALVDFEDSFVRTHAQNAAAPKGPDAELTLEEALGQADKDLPASGVNALAAFLEQALLTVEPTVHNVQTGQTEAISLMTIHSAKGLEFDRVFLAGLEEGVLPHTNSLESEAAVEEERRLMYVAVTRARGQLTMSHIRRNRYRPDFPAEPSRFLTEVPFECVEHIRPEGYRSYREQRDQREQRDESARPQRPGQAFGHKSNERTQFTWAAEDTPGTVQEPQRSGARAGGKTAAELRAMLRSADSLASGANPMGSGDGDGAASWHQGQMVKHKLFGVGTIQRIEKSLDGFRLEVRFPVVGTKKLMHTYVTPVEDNQGI